MPEVLIMAKDGCNGPEATPRAIAAVRDHYKYQYEKVHILILLLTNFKRQLHSRTVFESRIQNYTAIHKLHCTTGPIQKKPVS